jgi:hypothetical protein
LDHLTTTTAAGARRQHAIVVASIRIRSDIVDDSREVFVHVPLRTSVP